MEIIKHGKNFRIVECPDCECEFRFGTKEIHQHYGEVMTFYCVYDYVECPECGRRIILEDRSIEE